MNNSRGSRGMRDELAGWIPGKRRKVKRRGGGKTKQSHPRGGERERGGPAKRPQTSSGLVSILTRQKRPVVLYRAPHMLGFLRFTEASKRRGKVYSTDEFYRLAHAPVLGRGKQRYWTQPRRTLGTSAGQSVFGASLPSFSPVGTFGFWLRARGRFVIDHTPSPWVPHP